MPRNSEEAAEGGRLWHRKSLSLDLGGSSSRERSSKAAAWMWHLHKLNEASIPAAQEQASESDALESKRRSSGDHKDSRFPLYLIEGASRPSSCGVWDCDSKLYDTFELVSFSNCLDRSLLGVPAVEALNLHRARSPLHHASVLRSVSLPRASLSLRSPASATPPPPGSNSEMAASYGPPSLHGSVVDAITPCSSNTQTLVLARKPKSWLAKFVKEVVSSHGQMWCFKPFFVEGEQTTSAERSGRVRRQYALDEELGGGMAEQRERYHRVYEKEEVEERHKHLHHHHHHYHYHFLQQLDQSAQDAEAHSCKPSTTSQLDAESKTMSKMYADKNWI